MAKIWLDHGWSPARSRSNSDDAEQQWVLERAKEKSYCAFSHSARLDGGLDIARGGMDGGSIVTHKRAGTIAQHIKFVYIYIQSVHNGFFLSLNFK